jgi:serine/threonine protein kinase/Tfp pilus assembly protein PilF
MELTAGTKLGVFEILGSLGAGGMGEVYRARDTRLDREVALKMLPRTNAADARALDRFHREARVVASLNHPHICTLYDVGEYDRQPFLLMELLDGGTLESRISSKPLPIHETVEWGMQIADALETAHARGIVHRDLKPANIMITSRGDVKILDFGIAKLAGDRVASETTLASLTAEGSTIGTVAYMAPEQVRGEMVDSRADLFALGVVLYEMTTGRRPFGGATTGVILDGILNRDPAPPQATNPAVPPVLAGIIAKLLEKDRVLRYQKAADVRADLKRAQRDASGTAEASARTESAVRREASGPLRTAGRAVPASVAVLPFRNMSNDAENAFFSDGIAEDLIDALARVEGLRVASRASTFRFRDSPDALKETAMALGVAAVVEGSVRRAGTKLRVSARLVDAASGFQLWSDKYDREMADVFEIQDEIVGALVAALAPALLADARAVVRRPTDNLEAYECYLRGRHYWHQRSPSTLRLAIQSFEQAIGLDPEYALAYAGLADSWALYRPYGWLPIDACRPQAERAVGQAMALGPDLAEVQFAQALHILYFHRHWRAAEPHFARAVELNPRWSLARAFYGVFLAGNYRADEARVQAAAAIELDPLSPFIHGAAGMTAFAVGDVAQAERAARRALELQPDFLMGTWLLAIALDDAGRLEEAEAMIGRATAISRAPIFVAMVAKIHARQGRAVECARIEAEIEDRRTRGEYIPRACDVIIATGRKDIPALRAALRACVEEEANWLTVRLGPGPELESFRQDPEVDALLDQLNDGARPRLIAT